MFVLADMEWVTNRQEHISPVQLAALKVDECWNITDSFSSLIRPKDESFCIYDHPAFTGAAMGAFLKANSPYTVFERFFNWLDENDIILWWSKQAKNAFSMLNKIILKDKFFYASVHAAPYITDYLSQSQKVNLYRLAEKYGIYTKPLLEHSSQNDVSVFCKLLKKIEFSQVLFYFPFTSSQQKSAQNAGTTAVEMPYQYDFETNVFHKNGCKLIVEKKDTVRGFSEIGTAVRKMYKPCVCCRLEFLAARKNRNRNIIERMECDYVCAKGSGVFHRHDCGLVLGAKEVLGFKTFENISASGRVPCKVCNPEPAGVLNKNGEKVTSSGLTIGGGFRPLNEIEKKAVLRQKHAFKEREERLKNATESVDDIYTLTQPGFAFWAGQGYRTFHSRGCPKLGSVSGLRGFATYEQAVRAGYAPCKHCRPDSKDNVTVSIPITNRERPWETPEALETKSVEYGYRVSREKDAVFIDTEVGRWKVVIGKPPICIFHINLAMSPFETEYHRQPRLFLSYTDAVDYIKRHDDSLLKKCANNSFNLTFKCTNKKTAQ